MCTAHLAKSVVAVEALTSGKRALQEQEAMEIFGLQRSNQMLAHSTCRDGQHIIACGDRDSSVVLESIAEIFWNCPVVINERGHPLCHCVTELRGFVRCGILNLAKIPDILMDGRDCFPPANIDMVHLHSDPQSQKMLHTGRTTHQMPETIAIGMPEEFGRMWTSSCKSIS